MQLLLGKTPRPVDLIVFDCDGVLLDTLPRKIQAFREWVEEAGRGHEEAFMDCIMKGFGKSRATHVRHYYEEILGEQPDSGFIEREVDRFTAICEPLCAGAGWREGSREFVEACRRAGLPRYVLSGTPQQPLEEMLAANGGDGLFDRVYGSPPAKPEKMEQILEQTGVPSDRCVFVGDANADHEAALHVGAHFVYLPSEAHPPERPVETQVDDLRALLPREA